jgi:hypothetical protein
MRFEGVKNEFFWQRWASFECRLIIPENRISFVQGEVKPLLSMLCIHGVIR